MPGADLEVQHSVYRSFGRWIRSTTQTLRAVPHQHLSYVRARKEYPVSNGDEHSTLSILCTSLKKTNRTPSLGFVSHNVPSAMNPDDYGCCALLESSLGNRYVEEEAVFTFSRPNRCVCQTRIGPERSTLRAYLAVGPILDTCRAIVQGRLRGGKSQRAQGRCCVSNIGESEIGRVFL